MYIIEPQKKIPVAYHADLCVVGGSATGVFAAVRAARLGLRVLIVEKQNGFGGVAVGGLVNVWHTYLDTDGKKQVIAGLSEEVTDRLDPFNAGHVDKAGSHVFNPHELKTELDKLVQEHNIQFLFHTFYCGLVTDGNRITAVFIENKDGRQAIQADFFIDATGDGDLARDLGMEAYAHDSIQPPSACFLLQGDMEGVDLQELIAQHGREFGLEADWGWDCVVPRCPNISMRAETHVFGLACHRAGELSMAEVEGRRKNRAIIELLNRYGKPGCVYNNVSACSHIGIRETVHYKTKWQANELDLLLGRRYEDAILNGTYGVDIHHDNRGITFRYFDGTYTVDREDGTRMEGNWRTEQGIAADTPVPTWYQLPFRCLVPERVENLIAAGRMIHADAGAFGALRVMVNLNQIGEAAGVAAYLALHQNKTVQALDGVDVAKTLSAGGSANLG